MRRKKQISGLTLVELVIAVTVLAVGVAGIITAFQVGVRQSALASDITIAGIEAQLWMERLVGLYMDEGDSTSPMYLEIEGAGGSFTTDASDPPEPFASNDLWISILIEPHQLDPLLTNLRDVTIFVHHSQNPDWFFRHSNILNVTGQLV